MKEFKRMWLDVLFLISLYFVCGPSVVGYAAAVLFVLRLLSF